MHPEIYKLKQKPEDFKVFEKSSSHISTEPSLYIVCRLKKTNYTTETALSLIARNLGLPRKYIGCAGNKDSRAITEQNISIKNSTPEKIGMIHLKDIEITFLGFSDQPISLGDLLANEFEIIIRNISSVPQKKDFYINYFGEQRFSKNNSDVGKAIITKEFSKAITLICESSENDKTSLEKYLKTHTRDFIGALKTIPWKNLMLYVHAYQSKLWNLCASNIACDIKQDEKEKILLPIIGFATEFDNERIKEIYEKIISDENISLSNFIIKQIPDLSSEGTMRPLYSKISDLEIGTLEDDELNSGMKKCTVKFKLGKGCYATEAIKALMSD